MPDLIPSSQLIGRAERERLLGQRGAVVWFTGLSGSGKSTLARALEARLVLAGRLAYVLDGDNLRHGLNADLGFTAADRHENVRRVGCVAALLADAGAIAIAALISPYRADRARARSAAAGLPFIEVHLATSLAACERRDPKGLYRKARAGHLKSFTGIDDPYEAPDAPEVVIDTERQPVEAALAELLEAFAKAQAGAVPDRRQA